jgi:5-methylthioadenosine/S-adenosylhomocysteine deaminase
VRTLIKDAYVITMDDAVGSIPNGDVLIVGDTIQGVGQGLDSSEVDWIIDGANRIVMPGLVDGHRHMFSGILRGCGSNAQYADYFDRIISKYAVNYTPEDTYVAVRLGMAEAVDAGTTLMHAWEHNLTTPGHADASLRALSESGLRGRFSYGPRNDTMLVDTDDVLRMRDEAFTHHEDGMFMTEDRRLHLGVATRGVELSRPEIWTREFGFSRENNLPITAHVMARNITEMAEADALGPDVLSVHANDATSEEIDYLATCGTPVCVAPSAIARSGIGFSPVVELMRAGVPISLSVDSIAGCDTADMFAVMRFNLLTQRMIHRDISVYSPQDALRHATIEGAKTLGLDATTGSLTSGKRADVIVLRADDLNMAPLNVPEAQVVLAAQHYNVETVFIDGVCHKREGKLLTTSKDEVVEAAKKAVQELGERVGERIH